VLWDALMQAVSTLSELSTLGIDEVLSAVPIENADDPEDLEDLLGWLPGAIEFLEQVQVAIREGQWTPGRVS